MLIKKDTIKSIQNKIKNTINYLIHSIGTLKYAGHQEETIEDTKRQLMFWILITINIFGIPAIIIAAMESLSLKQGLVSISYFLFFSPIILITIYWKKTPYQVVALVIIIFNYIIGVANLVFGGLVEQESLSFLLL